MLIIWYDLVDLYSSMIMLNQIKINFKTICNIFYYLIILNHIKFTLLELILLKLGKYYVLHNVQIIRATTSYQLIHNLWNVNGSLNQAE